MVPKILLHTSKTGFEKRMLVGAERRMEERGRGETEVKRIKIQITVGAGEPRERSSAQGRRE